MPRPAYVVADWLDWLVTVGFVLAAFVVILIAGAIVRHRADREIDE